MSRPRTELPVVSQSVGTFPARLLDKFHDQCAVFGIYGHKEAANIVYLGLYALQHRGQEGSGIVSSDGETFHVEKGLGLVADIYTKSAIRRLHGHMAIGHNRYSTAGGGGLKNVQPLTVNFAFGNLALAHNGNLINAQMLRSELEAYGAIFQSTTDSEVIIHLIAHSRANTLLARIVDALSQVRGAFSVVILTDESVIAARDPYGLRPLCLGQVRGSWVVASETCAFDLIGGDYVRDIEPGELVVLDHRGVTSLKPFAQTRQAMCVFEYVYFSRPDSRIFGGNPVYLTRKAYGRQLAKESHVPADVVIAVPDSGVPAALGYAEGAGIPFETGLIRNHYVGRTFIEPEERIRHFGVKVKLNAVPEVLKGKRVVVVDDSLVRGTTSRKIVKMIRHAGAKEVHVRISSPPIISPCFYGIDTPTKKELVASSHTIQEIKKYITADSLAYLSLEGMLKVSPGSADDYCRACFTGQYPIPFTQAEELQLGLFDPHAEATVEVLTDRPRA
jgi:amidophosphoribosyltransferase